MAGILVIGNGFLGRSVVRAAGRAGIGVRMASRSSDLMVDVTKIATVEHVVVETGPDVIINCAAITDLGAIEKNPEEAYSVNAHGAENIAKVASAHSKRLVHISTDSVFDGERGRYSEKDEPCPVNEYARSKKLGEDLSMGAMNDCMVVRTNFYGDNPDGRFLFNWILENLGAGRRFGGFTNVRFNPLEVGDLAEALIELARSRHRGLLHLGSDKAYSKYEFARTVATKLGYDVGLIAKSELGDDLAPRRPHDTTLNNALSKRVMKFRPRELEAWLEEIKPHMP